MLLRYAKSLYLEKGGDPRVLEELRWSEVMDWLEVQDILEARSTVGGLPDGA